MWGVMPGRAGARGAASRRGAGPTTGRATGLPPSRSSGQRSDHSTHPATTPSRPSRYRSSRPGASCRCSLRPGARGLPDQRGHRPHDELRHLHCATRAGVRAAVPAARSPSPRAAAAGCPSVNSPRSPHPEDDLRVQAAGSTEDGRPAGRGPERATGCSCRGTTRRGRDGGRLGGAGGRRPGVPARGRFAGAGIGVGHRGTGRGEGRPLVPARPHPRRPAATLAAGPAGRPRRGQHGALPLIDAAPEPARRAAPRRPPRRTRRRSA